MAPRQKHESEHRTVDETPEFSATRAFEQAVATASDARFVLRLYVAGSGERSMRAVAKLRALCDKHLPGRYELRVIDIYQQPGEAEAGDVIAAPTLVKELPLPLRRIVGDLADEGRVLLALGASVG